MGEVLKNIKEHKAVKKFSQASHRFLIENIKTLGVDEDTAYLYLAFALGILAVIPLVIRKIKKDK